MIDERQLQLNPIVPESVQHNARVCILFSISPLLPYHEFQIYRIVSHEIQTTSNIRSLTASLFGVAAGTLGLESFPGFIFYFLGTAIVSLLIFALKTEQKPEKYFFRVVGDLWVGDLFGGLMSFVLTWTVFYGLCKA